MSDRCQISLPLMEDNITREDNEQVIAFLRTMPRLTQSAQVRAFEEEWSAWLGVRHATFVNSGASANLVTLAALRHLHGPGEVIVPTLTWVSDIAATLQNGFAPVFVDLDPRHLGMAEEQVLAKLGPKTRAVFVTYVQGFNCLTPRLLAELEARGIPLIEDVCESHGATFQGRRLGSFGLASNFSYYFAHHMSTIEGGMICTHDDRFHQTVRMLRSHGMVREAPSAALRAEYARANPELNPDFIFAHPGYNCRNTEIGAVFGRSQLKRLDANNRRRQENFALFLSLLDPAKYRTDFAVEGSCNYAFALVIRQPDLAFRGRLETALQQAGVEFRRGSSGGGNQLRQPYLKGVVPEGCWRQFPEVEHIHHFGYYVGNFPSLEAERIRQLCALLNGLE